MLIEIPIKHADVGARFIAPLAVTITEGAQFIASVVATITEGAINRAPTVRGM
jgi:hypothetical protein